MFGFFRPDHSQWRYRRRWRRMGMGRLLLGLLFAPMLFKRAMCWRRGWGGYGGYGHHGHGGCHGGWRGGPRREWREWSGWRGGPHGPDDIHYV